MTTNNKLFIFILLLATNISLAQTIDIEGEWRVNYQQSWAPGEFYNNQYRDFIDGDTMLNSKEYYKFYSSGCTFSGFFPGADVIYYSHILHGLIREENNRWYTWIDDKDSLMYDFTMNIGDTVFPVFAYSTEFPFIVVAIDSILVDGDYKKRWQLNGNGAEYIIEGIGATSGLFENMVFFEWYSDLVCYAINGASVWGASTDECDLAVNADETLVSQMPVSLDPNPAKEFSILFLPQNIGKATFILIDLMGRIVYEESFESPSSSKIDLTTYQPGIYLGVIESRSGRKALKLIIE